MFPGSPAPLPASTSLTAILRLIPAGGTAGVWLRGCRLPCRAHFPGGRGVLLAADLGILLRRCEQILVRHGGLIDLLSASTLIRCRVLEIVLGTPYLPAPAQLRELYPAVAEGRDGYAIPLGLGSAEEALALCAAERLPVRSSRIRYAAISG